MMKTELELPQEPTNATATIGVVLSALGLVGWLSVAVLLSRDAYAEASDVEVLNLLVVLNNVVVFLINAAVGLLGMGVNFTLSGVGLMLGVVSLNHPRRRPAYIAIGLSAAGLLLGVAILIWRLTYVGLL